MPRRSLISMTTINRFISSASRRRKEKEREDLIFAQSGRCKEMPPSYTLMLVDFNIETRVTKLEFQQTQKYRTIDRYITQNYVRYPVYSEWKTKTKTIKKSIKLTNQELESLNINSDSLISRFSEEIINSLYSEDLYPSWFIKLYLKKEYEEINQELENKQLQFTATINSQIKNFSDEISKHKNTIKEIKIKLAKLEHHYNKIQKRLNKAEKAKKSIFLNIFTFGIYCFYRSPKRKEKFNKQLTYLSQIINDLENEIALKNKNISNIQNEIKELDDKIKNNDIEIKAQQECELKNYLSKVDEVQPLSCIYQRSDSFVPLKLIIGLEYEKIIGCYVIRNKENDKHYVGQSKDVLKRIKQHFKGTTPNNIVFAEDYYTSQLENKEDLFEIRIIPCETKDELDRTEKELISDYDSYNSGYNGTNGNT